MGTNHFHGSVGVVTDKAKIETLNVGGQVSQVTNNLLMKDINDLLAALGERQTSDERMADSRRLLTEARDQAAGGDIPAAKAKLKQVGQWILDGIRDIGANVAADIITGKVG